MHVRARYSGADSGPWSNTVRLTVASGTIDNTDSESESDLARTIESDLVTILDSDLVTILDSEEEGAADPDATRDGAIDLGDITDFDETEYTPRYTINGTDDLVDYFKFTITEPKFLSIGIRQLDADASFKIEDANGTVLQSKSGPGKTNLLVYGTYLAGTYYIPGGSGRGGRQRVQGVL